MVQPVGSRIQVKAPRVDAGASKLPAPPVTGVVNSIASGPAFKDPHGVSLIEGGAEFFQRGGRLSVVLVPQDRQTRTKLPAGSSTSFPADALVEQKFRMVNGRPVPEVDTDFDVDDIILQAQGYHSDPTLAQEGRIRVFLYTGQLSDLKST